MKRILEFSALFSLLFGNISFTEAQRGGVPDINRQKAQEIIISSPSDEFRSAYPGVEEYTGRPLTEDEFLLNAISQERMKKRVEENSKNNEARNSETQITKGINDFKAGKITEEELLFILKLAGAGIVGGTTFFASGDLWQLIKSGAIRGRALISFITSKSILPSGEILLHPLEKDLAIPLLGREVVKLPARRSFGGIVGRFLQRVNPIAGGVLTVDIGGRLIICGEKKSEVALREGVELSAARGAFHRCLRECRSKNIPECRGLSMDDLMRNTPRSCINEQQRVADVQRQIRDIKEAYPYCFQK